MERAGSGHHSSFTIALRAEDVCDEMWAKKAAGRGEVFCYSLLLEWHLEEPHSGTEIHGTTRVKSRIFSF